MIWTKPLQDWSKVSFHAIIKNSFPTQAAVCRNHKGEINQIVTQVRPPCSQVYGEALVAKLATELASSLQLKKFILEGESNTVITALISSVCSLDTPLDLIIKETLLNFSDSSLWEARKISRNENLCAHYVAYRAAARVPLGCIPFLSSPQFNPIMQWKRSIPHYSSLVRLFDVLAGSFFVCCYLALVLWLGACCLSM